MKVAREPSTTTSNRVGTVKQTAGDFRATKVKVIERLKALSPALVASGAIVDARATALTNDLPPTPPKRFSGLK